MERYAALTKPAEQIRLCRTRFSLWGNAGAPFAAKNIHRRLTIVRAVLSRPILMQINDGVRKAGLLRPAAAMLCCEAPRRPLHAASGRRSLATP